MAVITSTRQHQKYKATSTATDIIWQTNDQTENQVKIIDEDEIAQLVGLIE